MKAEENRSTATLEHRLRRALAAAGVVNDGGTRSAEKDRVLVCDSTHVTIWNHGREKCRESNVATPEGYSPVGRLCARANERSQDRCLDWNAWHTSVLLK